MESSSNSSAAVVIGAMVSADFPDVIDLEERNGLNSLGRAGFERQLAKSGSILLVARSESSVGNGGVLQGSLSGWVIADEFQIDNIVVAETARRKGIGSILIRHSATSALGLGAAKAVLEVRAGNLSARLLYERLGFRIVGRRPEYYHEPLDDALIMVCRGGDWERLVA